VAVSGPNPVVTLTGDDHVGAGRPPQVVLARDPTIVGRRSWQSPLAGVPPTALPLPSTAATES
jgi:hypothetical protein